MALLYDTYFVVAVSFVVFLAILWRYDVHGLILRALDARAERIRAELDDARRLRDEAQALLASFERRQSEVQETADAIVARAREDAGSAAEAARRDLAASIERRIRGAEAQIAAAEAAAVREIKDRAVAIAADAAAEVLHETVTGDDARIRVDESIREVAARLN